MEAFQGAMMGLAATSFWRKDFGAHGVAMDAVLAAVPLTMAIAPDGATGSGFILVSVLALTAAAFDIACFHSILPRASSGATKLWRMFLLTSILWACVRYSALTECWHFGAVSVGSGALQLLRRPEWLKAALRDWRVATGPVYTLATGLAFYHHLHRTESGDACVAFVGIWAVATAAILLRPDNSKLDMALVMVLPVRARIWPTSPRRRTMCHGLLMLLSMVLMAVLLVRERAWGLLCICGALLAMETLRRLHSRGMRGASAPAGRTAAVKSRGAELPTMGSGSIPSREDPPARPVATATVLASPTLPDCVLHMICRAAVGESLSALEMASRSWRSSVKTCVYVDADGAKAYRLDVGDGEETLFKVWNGQPFYFEDWDGWRFFYEEWDGQRHYYDYSGDQRFYYDYVGGEKFFYDYTDGQKLYYVIGNDGLRFFFDEWDGERAYYDYVGGQRFYYDYVGGEKFFYDYTD